MNQAIKWTIIFICLIAYGLIVAFSGHFWASLLVLFVLLSIGIYDAEIAKWIDKWHRRRQTVRRAISAIIQNFCSTLSRRLTELVEGCQLALSGGGPPSESTISSSTMLRQRSFQSWG